MTTHYRYAKTHPTVTTLHDYLKKHNCHGVLAFVDSFDNISGGSGSVCTTITNMSNKIKNDTRLQCSSELSDCKLVFSLNTGRSIQKEIFSRTPDSYYRFFHYSTTLKCWLAVQKLYFEHALTKIVTNPQKYDTLNMIVTCIKIWIDKCLTDNIKYELKIDNEIFVKGKQLNPKIYTDTSNIHNVILEYHSSYPSHDNDNHITVQYYDDDSDFTDPLNDDSDIENNNSKRSRYYEC